MKAHSDRDPAAVHQKPHLYNGIRAVLLAYTVFSQPWHDLARHLVNNFLIFLFAFEVKVGAVIIHHSRVSFYYVIAGFIQPDKVFAIVFLQDIHEPEDLVVSKGRLLIVCTQIIPGCMFGLWIKYPGIYKEAGDRIAVISDLSSFSLLIKELLQKKPFHHFLQEKVPNVQRV